MHMSAPSALRKWARPSPNATLTPRTHTHIYLNLSFFLSISIYLSMGRSTYIYRSVSICIWAHLRLGGMGAPLAIGDPHYTHTNLYLSIHLTVSIYPYVYERTSGLGKWARPSPWATHTPIIHTHTHKSMSIYLSNCFYLSICI